MAIINRKKSIIVLLVEWTAVILLIHVYVDFTDLFHTKMFYNIIQIARKDDFETISYLFSYVLDIWLFILKNALYSKNNL
jgi:hypothetical protein